MVSELDTWVITTNSIRARHTAVSYYKWYQSIALINGLWALQMVSESDIEHTPYKWVVSITDRIRVRHRGLWALQMVSELDIEGWMITNGIRVRADTTLTNGTRAGLWVITHDKVVSEPVIEWWIITNGIRARHRVGDYYKWYQGWVSQSFQWY